MAESSPFSPTKGKTRRGSIGQPPPSMSKELQCSICLDVLTDPVSIPCGHNFCKNCLNSSWKNSWKYSCPYCKQSFRQRPELKINTALREILEHYRETSSEKKPEVVCDVCEGRKLKALKSCLTCQSSYCQTHLEPHSRVEGLKKHKLMDPVSNLKHYICQKHDRHLEIYCRDDHTSVCLICSLMDHRDHNTIPIEEESKERKTQLIKTQKDVQQMIQDREKKIEDVKCRKICQTELLEMIEEKQKVTEKQEEELEQEITELKKRNTELELFFHTEDHLHLLQIYSSLSEPTDTRNWPETSLGILRRDFTQLKENIEEKLTQTELKWIQQYAVDVTLDPDTAHPHLILTDDRKQVRHGDIKQELPVNSQRFDTCEIVFGKEVFSSGRFYFEVQVKDKTDWDLGVARESVDRKGQIKLSPSNGIWTVIMRNENEYKACASPSVILSLRVKPQRVGVFVDYEEGSVSFYDVESSSHIYSFTGESFSDKLYPYFSPESNKGGKNSAPLIITPVNYNK